MAAEVMVLAIVSCVGGVITAVGGVVSACKSYMKHKAMLDKEEFCLICRKPVKIRLLGEHIESHGVKEEQLEEGEYIQINGRSAADAGP